MAYKPFMQSQSAQDIINNYINGGGYGQSFPTTNTNSAGMYRNPYYDLRTVQENAGELDPSAQNPNPVFVPSTPPESPSEDNGYSCPVGQTYDPILGKCVDIITGESSDNNTTTVPEDNRNPVQKDLDTAGISDQLLGGMEIKDPSYFNKYGQIGSAIGALFGMPFLGALTGGLGYMAQQNAYKRLVDEGILTQNENGSYMTSMGIQAKLMDAQRKQRFAEQGFQTDAMKQAKDNALAQIQGQSYDPYSGNYANMQIASAMSGAGDSADPVYKEKNFNRLGQYTGQAGTNPYASDNFDMEKAQQDSYKAYAEAGYNPDGTKISAKDAGGGRGGNSKIVCTMMNESYGFGSFRNKIWLRHSANLSPEYQLGYHQLFLPLVAYAKKKGFTNKIVKKVLEHIAVHRTIDIRQEEKGKVHALGRVYRTVLEPLCYMVGKYVRERN